MCFVWTTIRGNALLHSTELQCGERTEPPACCLGARRALSVILVLRLVSSGRLVPGA